MLGSKPCLTLFNWQEKWKRKAAGANLG